MAGKPRVGVRVVRGMKIPRGLTLIVGGGFHGKTTLLEAIQTGVYNKIPGDGREFVVTDENTVKVGIEAGRLHRSSALFDSLRSAALLSVFGSSDRC